MTGLRDTGYGPRTEHGALLAYRNDSTESLPESWTPSNLRHAIEAARQHLDNLGCQHVYERGECLSCVLRVELRRLGVVS